MSPRCLSIFVHGNLPQVRDGGAIRITAGVVYIHGGAFRNNTASGNGGAIYNSRTGMVFVNHATLENNTANCDTHGDLGGGAIYNLGTAYVANSRFINNTAKIGHDGGGRGGSIFNGKAGLLYLLNTSLSGGKSAFGGAVYNLNWAVYMQHVTMADNNMVKNNIEVPDFNGDAFYNEDDLFLFIKNTTFKGNRVDASVCPA